MLLPFFFLVFRFFVSPTGVRIRRKKAIRSIPVLISFLQKDYLLLFQGNHFPYFAPWHQLAFNNSNLKTDQLSQQAADLDILTFTDNTVASLLHVRPTQAFCPIDIRQKPPGWHWRRRVLLHKLSRLRLDLNILALIGDFLHYRTQFVSASNTTYPLTPVRSGVHKVLSRAFFWS